MIEIALMYLEKIGLIIQGVLSADILIVDGVSVPVLIYFVFIWVIFFFVYVLRELGNRRG